jgi:hypothetical protein
MISPVFSRKVGSSPRSRSAAQVGSARRSCQTIALYSGSPVRRFHTTVVSRWLVMPIDAMSFAVTPAFASASFAVASCVCQISIGSCSTQPGCG